jgi:short-subunit dehydrogenase
MRQLQGMSITITGASAGIGAALARELHGRGARLTLAARRLDRLTELCQALPGSHHVVADVASVHDCARLVAASPALDTLVCNAGYGLARPMAETSDEEWLNILRTNLLGTTACIRAAVPRLRANAIRDGWRGHIVIVSSALARRAKPDAGAYCATKAAQLSIAEALRVELAAERIAVTSVHPIRTATDFVPATQGDPARARGIGPEQSAEHVARRIVAAIAKPRAEVWPHLLSRFGLAFAGLVPGLFDRTFARAR